MLHKLNPIVDTEVSLELDEADVEKFKRDAAWGAKCFLHTCYLKELYKDIEIMDVPYTPLENVSYDITKHLKTKELMLNLKPDLADFFNTDEHVVNTFSIMLCDDEKSKYGVKFYKFGNVIYLETKDC